MTDCYVEFDSETGIVTEWNENADVFMPCYFMDSNYEVVQYPSGSIHEAE